MAAPSVRPAVVVIGASVLAVVIAVALIIALALRPQNDLEQLAAAAAADEHAYRGIMLVDFAAAREATGLDQDAGLEEARHPEGVDPTSEEGLAYARFRSAWTVFPHLNFPSEQPAADSIDLGQVSAVAATTSRTVILVRTSQDIDEIVAGFSEAGYERDGDALLRVPEGTPPPPIGEAYTAIAWSDDLLALSAAPEEDGQGLLDGLEQHDSSDLSTWATGLMDDQDAPFVIAHPIDAENELAACVSRVGVADQLTGQAAYALQSDDPEGVEVTLTPQDDSIAYAEPDVGDGQVEVDVDATGSPTSPVLTFMETPYPSIWNCR
ncbi:hypothetical protein [Ruania alba]|nr:hypothetical protein [Ruania alba]